VLAGEFSGFQRIDGKSVRDGAASVRPGTIENGREYSLCAKIVISGDQAEITVTLDGKPFTRWQGKPTSLSIYEDWTFPNQGALGLAAWNAEVDFRNVRLRMLSGEAKPLRPGGNPGVPEKPVASEKPAPKEKPGKWIDLLASVDPEKDAVAGTWQRKDVLALVKSVEGARLALPWEVAGDYQLKVEFARTRGGADITFILPVGSRSTALILGKEGGARSGLFWAGGNSCDLVKPAPVENDKLHDLDVTVQTAAGKISVAVRLDGKPYFDWQGPESDVVIWDAFQLPNNASPGLGSWGGNEIVYKRVQIRMLSGDAKPLRPVAKPTGKP
jgi:hypothetical protein